MIGPILLSTLLVALLFAGYYRFLFSDDWPKALLAALLTAQVTINLTFIFKAVVS